MTSAQCIGDTYPYQGTPPNDNAAAPVNPASEDSYNAAAMSGNASASGISQSASPASTAFDALTSGKPAASTVPTSDKKLAHVDSGASMTSASLLLGIVCVISAASNLF
jgi:hypothetical protein